MVQSCPLLTVMLNCLCDVLGEELFFFSYQMGTPDADALLCRCKYLEKLMCNMVNIYLLSDFCVKFSISAGIF